MSALLKLLDQITRSPRTTIGSIEEKNLENAYHAKLRWADVSNANKEYTRSLEWVIEERKRQEEKWGQQNHNPYIYLAILLEEFGELAEAILQTQFRGEKGGFENIRKEATHTAAVALAILECLDRDKWRDDDVYFPRINPER